jgi:hypothetical protein
MRGSRYLMRVSRKEPELGRLSAKQIEQAAGTTGREGGMREHAGSAGVSAVPPGGGVAGGDVPGDGVDAGAVLTLTAVMG